jgi:hypothetical protein
MSIGDWGPKAKWASTAVLAVITALCINVAVYNWWSAGFFRGEYRQRYILRGNVFLILAALFLIALIWFLVAALRTMFGKR